MFSFINEFLNDFDFKTKSATKNNAFKYVNFNNEIFYLQSFKDIISFSDEEIIVKLFEGEISISGSNLTIKEISQRFLCIKGKISKIEVQNA